MVIMMRVQRTKRMRMKLTRMRDWVRVKSAVVKWMYYGLTVWAAQRKKIGRGESDKGKGVVYRIYDK